jgi:hypothetical protein
MKPLNRKSIGRGTRAFRFDQIIIIMQLCSDITDLTVISRPRTVLDKLQCCIKIISKIVNEISP